MRGRKGPHFSSRWSSGVWRLDGDRLMCQIIRAAVGVSPRCMFSRSCCDNSSENMYLFSYFWPRELLSIFPLCAEDAHGCHILSYPGRCLFPLSVFPINSSQSSAFPIRPASFLPWRTGCVLLGLYVQGSVTYKSLLAPLKAGDSVSIFASHSCCSPDFWRIWT